VNPSILLADIPEILGVLTGFGLVVIIPLFAIATSHRQKMAKLSGSTSDNSDRVRSLEHQVDSLRREVTELRHFITDNVLELDDRRLQQKLGGPPPPPL
jgi:hypothetical protein